MGILRGARGDGIILPVTGKDSFYAILLFKNSFNLFAYKKRFFFFGGGDQNSNVMKYMISFTEIMVTQKFCNSFGRLFFFFNKVLFK